ncbi:MAG: hypothetical protein K2Y51_26040 [Gammaproteobacteria bacterium]|nr:hypothetical protein [Gammaproteobacteria bacterium]
MDPDNIQSLGALSEEELEALRDAGELPKDEEDEEDEEAEGQDDADEGAEDEPPAKAAKADEPPADEKAEPDPEDEEDESVIPDYGADPKRLEEITAELKALEAEKTALRDRYAKGELGQDEYLEESDKLSDKRADLVSDKRLLEHAAHQAVRHAEAVWDAQQKRFWSRPENAVFARDKDPVLFEALNTQVKLLARENPALSGAAVLRQASEAIRTKFNLGGTAPKAEDAKPDPEKQKREAIARRAKQQADAQSRAPRTLVDVPPAAESDDQLSADEFAELDALLGDPNLDPLEVEARIARLTPDAERRFGTVRH